MKVAYYSSLPPERTGIADYSALLVPALRRRLDVDVLRRRRPKPPRDADLSLYHIGNDPDTSGWILEALRRWPGVVVLHEFVLHHLVAGLTIGRNYADGYVETMENEAGALGRLLALGVLDGCVPPLWETRPEDFSLASFVLDATKGKGVIVHSRYTEERVRASRYEGPVWRVPLAVAAPPHVEPARFDGPVVGCLGHVTLSKRILQLLEAFAHVHDAIPEARLLLVGAAAPRVDVDQLVRRMGVPPEAVVWAGWVDEERFWSLMAGCDVCVNLRAPTMGETSYSALRALSLGRPLVVNDLGWFAEIPDDAALKIPVDEREITRLAATLKLLLRRPDVAAAYGAAGRSFVAREHDLDRVAGLYAAALEEAAGGPAVRDEVVGELARAAAETGIAAGSLEAELVGARLREARIGE
jgi:glycosyltransferase involved in cell wall biosynthesis